MFKPLIAGVTALSLVFATAAPVQANGLDREDAGKLLIGLTALAVLGAALDNNSSQRESAPQTQVRDRDNRHPQGWNGHRQNRMTLPGDCLRGVQTRFGTQRMFIRQCLTRNDVRLRDLPRRCEVRAYTNDGPRNGYDPLCMREAGYRIDRRR